LKDFFCSSSHRRNISYYLLEKDLKMIQRRKRTRKESQRTIRHFL